LGRNFDLGHGRGTRRAKPENADEGGELPKRSHISFEAKAAMRENKTNLRFRREIQPAPGKLEAMSPQSSASKLVATVLGSGTSQGVPMIGCRCAVCQSTDPRDKRTRSSIHLTTPTAKILVDTTPDLRQQALREDLDRLDAVLFTHPHSDHIMGFDDLRRFCEIGGNPLPIYGSENTLEQLERVFFYAFNPQNVVPGYVHVLPHAVTGSFVLGGVEITPLPVPHGAVTTLGYLFSSGGRKLLAYISDCAAVPDPVREVVTGVEILIIDGLRDKPHPTHLNVAGAVEVAQAVGARQSFLTHLTHEKSHVDRAAGLPAGIDVSYDGMKFEFRLE
jgi:phosphoribosyl 1,2-cyclic phosphate phosphodiesterase